MKTKIHLDAFLITGIAISLFISLILYLRGTDTAISVLIALVGTVVTLQVDMFARIEKLKAESDEARVIYKKIHDNSPFTDSILSLLDRVDTIAKGQTNEILMDFAKREFDEVNENLRSVAVGRVELDYWNSDLLVKSIEQCKHEIRAVSPMAVDREWWKSAIGNKYRTYAKLSN